MATASVSTLQQGDRILVDGQERLLAHVCLVGPVWDRKAAILEDSEGACIELPGDAEVTLAPAAPVEMIVLRGVDAAARTWRNPGVLRTWKGLTPDQRLRCDVGYFQGVAEAAALVAGRTIGSVQDEIMGALLERVGER